MLAWFSPILLPLAALGLVALTALRFVAAAAMPLSPDEAYYWLWTRPLQLSYFDHPGMVAWWIWLGTHLVGQTALGVRLLTVLASAVTSVLVWDCARRVFRSAQVGVVAALWLNASLLFGAGAVLATPDAPLLLFWMLVLWALLRLIAEGRPCWLYVAGLALGLGADSKYTMGLLVPGALLMFGLAPELRRWWRSPHLWRAAGLAVAATAPLFVWNATHDFISIRKQFGHAFATPVASPFGNFLVWLGGQIGLVTPLLFVLAAGGMAWICWTGWRWKRSDRLLVGLLSLPVILFFAWHSFGEEVQAQWAGPGWMTATIAAPGLVPFLRRRRWGRILLPAAPILGFALTFLVYLQAATAILPIPPRIDPTKQLGGWDHLAQAVTMQLQSHPGAFLLAQKHEVEGLLGFYMQDHPTVFEAGGSLRPSHYSATDVAALKGHDALMVLRDSDNAMSYAHFFNDFSQLATVDLPWGGRVADHYVIWLGQSYRGGLIVEGDGVPGAYDTPRATK